MLKTVEKRIVEFAKDTGLTERREIVHGTLYVKLHEDKEQKITGFKMKSVG